jgi:hypothetical protein
VLTHKPGGELFESWHLFLGLGADASSTGQRHYDASRCKLSTSRLGFMNFGPALIAFTLLPLFAAGAGRQASSPPYHGITECLVTTPNGIAAGEPEPDPNSYGNAEISVGPFGLWPEGTVIFRPDGAGFITRDGSLGMKFGWRRGISGPLTIEGRRLDATAPPLRAEVPHGYQQRGFQASYVIFPTPGCWEVTGRVSEASVTFVTRVVKIGEGPSWRRNVP